jgi:hypothetical protein
MGNNRITALNQQKNNGVLVISGYDWSNVLPDTVA